MNSMSPELQSLAIRRRASLPTYCKKKNVLVCDAGYNERQSMLTLRKCEYDERFF